MSVISFVKIIGETKKSKKMHRYATHEGLNKRMPGYEVKMGFGLHVGWSIEGAIGSNFKIDASYLSPNVNMSARLEGATKGYGIPILFTGHLYDILTPKTQFYTR
jgi:class 3 adenylate cyclase